MTRSEARICAALLVAGAVALFAACPGPFDVEKTTYACRSPGDCVRGYQCHPTRFVCVPAGSFDAGISATPDAGMIPDGGTRRAIGAACTAADACDEGSCVHGRCCESACPGPCHRCDLTPGRCVAVPDGIDPGDDCAAATFNCTEYTFGIQQTSCFAGPNVRMTGGTCDGAGACRPRSCQSRGPGVELSKCLDPGCLRPGACLPNQPAAQYRDIARLCGIGAASTCDLGQGTVGCCSQRGDCCPAPLCQPTPQLCQ